MVARDRPPYNQRRRSPHLTASTPAAILPPMGVPVRIFVRWLIANLLVTLPAAYLLWHWRFEDGQTLQQLSFEAFHKDVLKESKPELWSFFVYATAAVLSLNLATIVVAWLLGLVFPNRQRS